MLFKEKMFLANCDPVRRLPGPELEKRLLLSVAFSKGAIVTPSLLLDNDGIAALLARPDLQRWFNSRDGRGGLVIRMPGGDSAAPLEDYFAALPPHHHLTRFGCAKDRLDRHALAGLRDDLRAIDAALNRLSAVYSPVNLRPSALSDAILASSAFAQWCAPDTPVEALRQQAPGLNSRSTWYRAAEATLGARAAAFKLEVIDACYNGLFVGKGEAFVMDRIPVLGDLPPQILSLGINAQSFNEQRRMFDYALKGIDLIGAFGAGQLASFLTREAVDFIEEKLQDTSLAWATRRNWFGLYTRLTKSMGIEIR